GGRHRRPWPAAVRVSLDRRVERDVGFGLGDQRIAADLDPLRGSRRVANPDWRIHGLCGAGPRPQFAVDEIGRLPDRFAEPVLQRDLVLTRKKLTQGARVDHRNLPGCGEPTALDPFPLRRSGSLWNSLLRLREVQGGASRAEFSKRPTTSVLEKVA